MVDRMNPNQRSELMSRVRTRDTGPELIVRRLLHAMGRRFVLHRNDLPGKPDIVLPKYETVIFVHGCFWHGHRDCKAAKRPQTNVEFWNAKIDANIERDRRTLKILQQMGWKTICIWECETTKGDVLKSRLNFKLLVPTNA